MTRIVALSWRHNTADNPLVPIAAATPTEPPGRGIVVRFSRAVHVTTPPNRIDGEHIFQVLIEDMRDQQGVFRCRCPVNGIVLPVRNIQEDTPGHIISAQRATTATADGIAFVAKPTVERFMLEASDLWVKLRGDFVIDINGKAIDAEFVRAELPTGDHPRSSPYGIQGGLFESWFRLGPPSPSVSNTEIQINAATVDELTTLPGISETIAKQIIARRRKTPFRDPAELLEIRGLGPTTLEAIKSLIKID